ncbi:MULTISPECIES: hypothetical protein [Halobacteriaceae]|uniref:Uncharacterized protein n=1 Tax=Halarchaeum nitratireducens TaxID=489913 RepID=A0A830GFG1_9EURY|nr:MULTISPECIES: hypothetical protein [Halobacteriaceae]MDL0118294.1 hypothetical protein [Halobacterium salinarum]MDL0119741.1 hypothetical protein [Halobacterium salinarum]GGN25640.1 hypothetical protein GCM10009021_29630 [Halarchaeum nitratireducens]
MDQTLTPGDEWPGYYRGYRLQTNADSEVWWQAYQGTDRLYLDPAPEALLDDLLSLKRLGGRVRVTEGNAVITRVEDGDSYSDIYVGEVELTGELVPNDEPEYAIDVQPQDLTSGDLWPSVYDGAKFSFGAERVWWQHPSTHKRHPVETDLPSGVRTTLDRLKPQGGSFRITPWGDVITLVEDPPNPEATRKQLHDLPRVIQNIILLRRERGVEMLPIYVGCLEDMPLKIGEPRSLTDELSPSERAQLDSWAGSLGPTSETSADDQRVSKPDDGPRDDPETW